jgi:hypothetical protein
MFQLCFIGYYQVVCLIQGNCTICDIKSSVFKEIPFSSTKFFSINTEWCELDIKLYKTVSTYLRKGGWSCNNLEMCLSVVQIAYHQKFKV